MQWVFRRLDRNNDGKLNHTDILGGSRLMGTTLSDTEVRGVLRELTGGLKDSASMEDFTGWWERTLKEAVVRQIHSYVEFSNILEQACCAASEDSSDYKEGPLVVLEVGTTHCRPCMKFARTFESVASRYEDVVFLKVMGDNSPAAAHLCRDILEVEASPEFRFYRNKELVHRFTGANKTKLEDSIQRLLGMPNRENVDSDAHEVIPQETNVSVNQ